MVWPGPSARDAPSAGFFAWPPDWRRMTREIRRAPLRFRIIDQLRGARCRLSTAERCEFGGFRASSNHRTGEGIRLMSCSTTPGRGWGRPVAVLSLTLLLLAGCTSVQVNPEAGAMEQLPAPDRVLVYNFAVTPQEVQLDAVGSAITSTFDGTADLQQEQQVGHAVANALAKRLVSDIQNMGLYAERAAGPVPPSGIDVLILGQLVSIDEGNARSGHRPRRRPQRRRGPCPGLPECFRQTHSRRDHVRDRQEHADAGCGGDDGGRRLDRASAGLGGDHRRLAGCQPDAERQRRLEAGRLADKVSDQLKSLFVQQGWIVPGS